LSESGEADTQASPSGDFLQFALICKQVESTRSKLAKVDAVAKYFVNLDDADLRLASTFLSSKIFPPGFATHEINVGYSLIWKAVSSFHQVKDGELSKYYFKYGDLGSAIEDWLRSNAADRTNQGGTLLLGEADLSLADFYSGLVDLAKASGKGSTERRSRILERIFTLGKDPLEVKFIVRILGGEMRIGMVEGLVEEAIAKASGTTLAEVRSANLILGDVGEVAVLARHNRLSEAKLSLFRPTNFMLAQSALDAEELYKKIGEVPALSEFKYDGIRAQLHFSGGITKIYSRNLEESQKLQKFSSMDR
jgi:DNA ligase 1